jgi:carbon monoxide dehydrogenase subunit G
MELIGEQLIAQTQDKVWAALNDTEILRACITGCESIEVVTDNEYKVGLFAAVGPLKARFTGKLTMLDVMPPDSYALNFEGAGGVAGFAKGNAAIKLTPEGEGTKLAYVVKVTVGGKLAQIGSRLIDGVAKKMSDEFFAAFNAKIANPAVQEASVASEAIVAPAQSAESAAAGNNAPIASSIAALAAAAESAQKAALMGSARPNTAAPATTPMLPWILFAAAVVIGVLAYISK